MRATVRAMVAAAALVLAPQAGAAQTGFGVEAAGIYATLSGDDFEGTDAGFGFDAQVRRQSGTFSVGAGIQYTSHYTDFIDENQTVFGIFAEPRLHFSVPASPVEPFVGARLGYLRRSASVSGFDISGSGFIYGATGGITFRAGPKVNIALAVVLAGVSFGDLKVDGETEPGTDAAGSSLAIRAGLSLKF